MARPLYPNTMSVERRARALRRIRQRVRYLLTFVALILVGEAIALALTSPHLQVNRVVVEGPRGALAAKALTGMRTGIGENIFLAPLDDLAHRVAGPPSFKSVEVSRRWPLTLVASVRLRSPYAVVRSGDVALLVDGELVPYAVATGPRRQLPEFEVPAGSAPKLGQSWSNRYLRASARCFEAARDRGLGISKISIDRVGDMCLNIENGIRVRAGAPQDLERKLWVVSQFLSSRRVPLDTIDYVDVSCPGAPAYGAKTVPAPGVSKA